MVMFWMPEMISLPYIELQKYSNTELYRKVILIVLGMISYDYLYLGRTTELQKYRTGSNV